jgi:hypothetical protein
MTVTEYIKLLERFVAQHGDLPIETGGIGIERVPARAPELAYRKILGKRERREEFSWNDENRGDPVCRI